MSHLKHCLLFYTALFFSLSSFAQEEKRNLVGIGASAGITNYTGDLDDNFTLKFSQPGFGAHVIYSFLKNSGVRFSFFQGWITADDAKATISKNKSRNLNFVSPVTEGGIQLIVKPFDKKGDGSERNRITPYFFGGIAVFKFNPKAKVNGELIPLQKLGTEGQYIGEGTPYKLTQLSVPFGMGTWYRLTRNIDIGMETGFRKTFTDYLDDVSSNYPDEAKLKSANEKAYQLSNRSGTEVGKGTQRGDSRFKDWYIYNNINLTWYIIPSKAKTKTNRNVRFL